MIPRPPGVRDDWGKANDEDQKREYWRWHFAGQIAAGMAAYPESPWGPVVIAGASVRTADALIAELEKETGE